MIYIYTVLYSILGRVTIFDHLAASSRSCFVVPGKIQMGRVSAAATRDWSPRDGVKKTGKKNCSL